MENSQLIVVGSVNPVKVQSALSGFEQMFPERSFSVKGISVPSGVSDQPMSDLETLSGALNRAQRLFDDQQDKNSQAEFFVGIEGGIEVIQDKFFANAWVVVLDRSGKTARSRSGSFELPPQVQQLVESGIELGHANDQVFKEHNSKQSGGAIGSLSGGVVTRESLYVHAVSLALVSFKQPNLF